MPVPAYLGATFRFFFHAPENQVAGLFEHGFGHGEVRRSKTACSRGKAVGMVEQPAYALMRGKIFEEECVSLLIALLVRWRFDESAENRRCAPERHGNNGLTVC